MKNSQKSKYLFSILIDFILILVLIFVISTCFLIASKILFPEQSEPCELKIRSEVMPREYQWELSEGDVVYDTLTKRRVGNIKSVQSLNRDGGIYFYITIDAAFKPRSKSLRTNKLWFYFAEEAQ